MIVNEEAHDVRSPSELGGARTETGVHVLDALELAAEGVWLGVDRMVTGGESDEPTGSLAGCDVHGAARQQLHVQAG